MLFYLNTPDEVTKVKQVDELPQEGSSLLQPLATAYMTQGEFGWVLSQCIKEEYLEIWQHHFFIAVPCKLIARNETPALVINYMIKGSPFTKITGLKHTAVEEGRYRMFYIPDVKHAVSFGPGKFESVHINFSPDLLKAATKNHQRLNQLIEFAVGDGENINPYQSGQIHESTLTDLMDLLWFPNTAGNRKTYISGLAWKLLRKYVLRHHAMRDDIAALEQYILTHLKHPIKTKQLERHCAMSRSKLYRLFKLQFNKNPAEYIQLLRVKEAKRFLSNTDMSIAQIAEEVGFTSISSFNRTFKKNTNYTPSQYRQMFY